MSSYILQRLNSRIKSLPERTRQRTGLEIKWLVLVRFQATDILMLSAIIMIPDTIFMRTHILYMSIERWKYNSLTFSFLNMVFALL